MPKRNLDKNIQANRGNGEPAAKIATSSTSKYFNSPKKLTREFYNHDGETLAKNLLGKNLVRIQDGVRLCAKIVETEAYLGLIDKAAHSYKGKRTDRTEAMFMDPGTAYVYPIYGLYCCMNISCKGEGCAILLRAVEPMEGLDKMKSLRWKTPNDKNDKEDKKTDTKTNEKDVKTKKLTKKEKDLCNGPSKMCQALNITKVEINQVDLVNSDVIWLEEGEIIQENKIINSARINIGYAEDWKDKLLRYYILDNNYVSVRDKEKEASHKT